MSRVVIFPVGKEAEADSYLAFCNANNPDTTPGAQWWPANWIDAHGQRYVGYLGPLGQWNGGNWPEPAGGEAARADGVLSDKVDVIIEE